MKKYNKKAAGACEKYANLFKTWNHEVVHENSAGNRRYV